MVWGSTSWNGVGSLIRLDGRVDSAAYQRILEDHMLQDPDHLIGDDFVFQQDSAPIHSSRSTREWLRAHDVTVLDWPPKSPDANPIENLWQQLKTAINRKRPTTANELWEAAVQAWSQIPSDHPSEKPKNRCTIGGCWNGTSSDRVAYVPEAGEEASNQICQTGRRRPFSEVFPRSREMLLETEMGCPEPLRQMEDSGCRRERATR